VSTPHAHDSDGIGSVAEEAARLFAAFESWVKDAAGGATTLVDAHVANGSAECQLCPVCRLISLLRGTRPEVFEHLVDATTSMLAAMRAAMDAHERSWSSRRHSPVQHIDIG
jgi:hypothetical protein